MRGRILILTSRFGGGHLRAAEELRDVFSEMGWMADIFDPFLVNKKKYSLLQKLYRLVSIKIPFIWGLLFYLTDKFQFFQYFFEKDKKIIGEILKKIEDFNPNYVLSTYPMFDKIINKKIPDRNFLLGTVITDSITINKTWLRGKSDHYFVIDPLSREKLLLSGIPNEKIYVTGFPTSSHPYCGEFEKRNKILIVHYSKKREIRRILKSLTGLRDYKLDVTTSGDVKFERKLKREFADFEGINIYHWIDGLKYKLGEYRYVITKAGGAIVNEIINSDTVPVVVYITSGQEVGNALLLKKYNLGFVISGLSRKKGERVARLIGGISEKDYEKKLDAIRSFPYKNGAKKILKLLEDEISAVQNQLCQKGNTSSGDKGGKINLY